MAFISVSASNVSALEQIYTVTNDELVITSCIICGVSSDAIIEFYISGQKLLSDYPLPQRGVALSEIEGQALSNNDTLVLGSDVPVNIRITARYLE